MTLTLTPLADYSARIFQSRRLYDLPGTSESKVGLLREPTLFRATYEGVEDSFIQDLIENNILKKNNYSHKSLLDAANTIALFESLSEEDKKKFLMLVKAFYLDKENLDLIEGLIIAGGEIRVIAATGPIMLLNSLFAILGIKPKKIHAISGGTFQAGALGLGATNSCMFKNAADIKFIDYAGKRKKLEDEWINSFLVECYELTTGKKVDTVRVKHFEELGVEVHSTVAELSKAGILLNYLRPEVFEIPGDKDKFEERFGGSSSEIPFKDIAGASANMPGLFHKIFPLDMTFGDCFIEGAKGKKHYLFDAGLHPNNSLPLHSYIKLIENYKKGRIEKMPFYFIVGNERVLDSEIPPDELKAFRENTRFMQRFVTTISKLADIGSTPPEERVKKLGAQKAYIKAKCIVTDPHTGEIAMLNTGNLKVPKDKRQALMCANIPTGDFQDLKFEAAVSQLYNNLVDPLYVKSDGKEGKSPYQRYLEDIESANPSRHYSNKKPT